MRKQKFFAYGFCLVMILGVCSGFAAERKVIHSSEMNMAREAIGKALAEIGLPKGDGFRERPAL